MRQPVWGTKWVCERGITRSLLSLVVSLPLLATAFALPSLCRAGEGPRYLADGVFAQDGKLVFEPAGGEGGAQGAAAVDLDGFEVVEDRFGDLFALRRRRADGTTIRLIDRSGEQVGQVELSPGKVGLPTIQGVAAFPEGGHTPLRPHKISFYDLKGQLKRSVDEPGLTIVNFSQQHGQYILTVNITPSTGDPTVVVYRADGSEVWRYGWAGSSTVQLAVTPDAERLVVAISQLESGKSEVRVLGSNNQLLASHVVPNVVSLATSPDSKWIAGAGQRAVVLLNAESGAIAWKADSNVDFIATGGLRFDPAEGRLWVLSAVRRQGTAGTLNARAFALADGAVEEFDLGETPLDGPPPALRDVVTGKPGTEELILYDRKVGVR